MAIGTIGAIALGVGALAGGAASVYGANKASGAAKDAAAQSAAVQQQQLQAAKTALSPYQQVGLPASQQINALLGLPTTSNGRPVGEVDWAAYVNGNPDALANWNAIQGHSDGARFGGDINAFGAYHYRGDGSRRDLTPYTSKAVDGSAAANAAFDQFKKSTGYQFRVGEGMNALNSGYAGAGTIKSGAAMKAATEYGQNMASQEFGNYLNALGNQQGVGMSAGSALAGVGQNYANSMGQIYGARGDAIGNAALTNASNINSLIGTLGAGILKYGK